MRCARPLVVGIALVASVSGPQLGAAGADEETDYGANHYCFSTAHEQPDSQHPGGVRFGLRVGTYLDDCQVEMILPDPTSP